MRDLLFHRFDNAAQSSQLSGYVEDEMVDDVASVVREVTLLLNTRSPLSASASAALPRRTVLEYGLADFLHLSPVSMDDAKQLARFIREAIVAYEPRLQVDNVVIDTPRPCRDAVYAVISGQVRKRDLSIVPVHFPVQVAVAARSIE